LTRGLPAGWPAYFTVRINARCPALAESIVVHFRFVANDPRMSNILRNAAQRLGMEWQGMLEAADHDGSVH